MAAEGLGCLFFLGLGVVAGVASIILIRSSVPSEQTLAKCQFETDKILPRETWTDNFGTRASLISKCMLSEGYKVSWGRPRCGFHGRRQDDAECYTRAGWFGEYSAQLEDWWFHEQQTQPNAGNK
jgi:hypothetical protein